MSPHTNTQSGFNDNITPSTESPTFTTPPPPLFLSKYYLENKFRAMFDELGSNI